jgi:hypothetical protein
MAYLQQFNLLASQYLSVKGPVGARKRGENMNVMPTCQFSKWRNKKYEIN